MTSTDTQLVNAQSNKEKIENIKYLNLKKLNLKIYLLIFLLAIKKMTLSRLPKKFVQFEKIFNVRYILLKINFQNKH